MIFKIDEPCKHYILMAILSHFIIKHKKIVISLFFLRCAARELITKTEYTSRR